MNYCSQCGSALLEGANFCQECGAKISKNNLIKNREQISIKEVNYTDVQPTQLRPKNSNQNKTQFNPIKIGILAGIIILSVGVGSYYICSLKLSSSGTRDDIYSNITEKLNKTPTNSTVNKPVDKNETSSAGKDNTKKDKNSDNIATRKNSEDGYIFPNSGDEKLSEPDLTSLSKENLALARNEIFARHGRVFKEEPYKSYFNRKTWYKPNPNLKNSNGELNDIERYNVDLILQYEKK